MYCASDIAKIVMSLKFSWIFGVYMNISVIVPVYNVAKYLSYCLDSLINQTLKDIEIVCVNDGSTDNSLEILQDYAKKHSNIRIINQINKGLGAARNVGVANATKSFIKPQKKTMRM